MSLPYEPRRRAADSAPGGLRDFGIRALKTFAQSTLAIVLADSAGVFSVSVWQAALAGGVASVLSLIQNWASDAESRGR